MTVAQPTSAGRRTTTPVFVLLCFTWGTTWLAIRIGVSHVPPLWFAATRFTVAGAVLLGWARMSGTVQRPTTAQFRALLFMGALCIAACFGLIFWGEQYVQSGVAGVVVQGFVPIGLLGFSAVFHLDKVRGRAWIAMALGVLGVAAITWNSFGQPGGRLVVLGLVAIVVGTLLYDLGSVLGGGVLREFSAVSASGWENLIGGVLLLPVSLAVEGDDVLRGEWARSGSAWTAWAYLVVFGSIMGFTCYTYLLQQWGPAKTSAYAFITPVVAFLVGWLFGNEHFTMAIALGSVLVVVAVFVLWSGRRAGRGTAAADLPDQDHSARDRSRR